MTILSFVKALPENLVYAPIYKKDAVMKSGRKATGKNPLEESWERDFDKHDVEPVSYTHLTLPTIYSV